MAIPGGGGGGRGPCSLPAQDRRAVPVVTRPAPRSGERGSRRLHRGCVGGRAGGLRPRRPPGEHGSGVSGRGPVALVGSAGAREGASVPQSTRAAGRAPADDSPPQPRGLRGLGAAGTHARFLRRAFQLRQQAIQLLMASFSPALAAEGWEQFRGAAAGQGGNSGAGGVELGVRGPPPQSPTPDVCGGP